MLYYSQFDENVNDALRKACDAMHLVHAAQIVRDLKVDIISKDSLSRLN